MSGKPASIPLLANVASGRSGEAAVARLEQFAEEQPGSFTVQPTSGRELVQEIQRVLARGNDRIAIAGGDGTLTTAADQLAGKGVTMVPVPIGTLNHFARKLGIESPEAGLGAIASGESRTVPVGVFDDQIFLNTATIGMYAEVVLRREKLRPYLMKWPAAAVAFATLLVRMRRVKVTLQVEGNYLQRETPLVWVGVGWGSFPRVHEAPEQRSSPDLEIVIVNARTRLSVMILLMRLLPGLFRRQRPFQAPALEIFHARSLTVHSAHRVGITIDGEVGFQRSPLFLAMQDEGLTVMVPRAEPAGES